MDSHETKRGRRTAGVGPFVLGALIVGAMLCAGGCSNYRYSEPSYFLDLEKDTLLRSLQIDRDMENRILALDADNITEEDIETTLKFAPAPRVHCIAGGTFFVHLQLESFADFLVGMGYPRDKLRHPGNGSYSSPCVDSGPRVAGLIAWYYEKEGLRPMLIGHSQGGVQAMRVLLELAGKMSSTINVRNPLTGRNEDRDWIIDPITGEKTPVTQVQCSYASVVGAGGVARTLPTHWRMSFRLRAVPDSVVEFTGFYIHGDVMGGDFLGFADKDSYKSNGTAEVRTVLLPFGHDHYFVPNTKHLARNKSTRDWINAYEPSAAPGYPDIDGRLTNIIWGAEVWTSIKRHWCLEAQRLIRAKRKLEKAG